MITKLHKLSAGFYLKDNEKYLSYDIVNILFLQLFLFIFDSHKARVVR